MPSKCKDAGAAEFFSSGETDTPQYSLTKVEVVTETSWESSDIRDHYWDHDEYPKNDFLREVSVRHNHNRIKVLN